MTKKNLTILIIILISIITFNNQITKETIINEVKTNNKISYYKEQYNNEDIIARLEIPELINILIVKGQDNEYYLNHSINKEQDKKGTEFMDYRNTPSSNHINIYGHNSKTYDLPFKRIEKFLQKEFFKTNKYIYLEFEEFTKKYLIFSIKEVSTDFIHMNISSSNIKEKIDKIKNKSIHIREINYNNNSNILILQTCSYNKKKSFYLLSAIEVEN